MKNNFEYCVNLVLHHEGGFVDHPKDPGGMTIYGVTKTNWDNYTNRTTTVEEFKALKQHNVLGFYKTRYWDRVKGDELPIGLDLCVFDFAVNSGVSRASKFTQTVVGATPDGGIGPKTLKAIDDYIAQHGIVKAIKTLQNDRLVYLQGLGTFDTFGKGWTRRVKDVECKAFYSVV